MESGEDRRAPEGAAAPTLLKGASCRGVGGTHKDLSKKTVHSSIEVQRFGLNLFKLGFLRQALTVIHYRVTGMSYNS